jgi:hypothetical protein
MNERKVREALRDAPLDDAAARARALAVVRAAYREREPAPARPRRFAPALAVLACALAAGVVALSVSAPGDAVARWVREVLGTGRPHARPALVRVPGGGRLLVGSAGAVWVVSPDGSRRRLGDFDGASWSPRGLYAVVWRDRELLAVEPTGVVHWSLARSAPIASARWSPLDGFRVAYVSGRTLRVVNGDGTDDRTLAAATAAVAPAWRPDTAHVVAYADRRDRVHVVPVDGGRELWRSSVPGVFELAWSPDGRRLVAATPRRLVVLGRNGRRLAVRTLPRGVVADSVSFSPRGRLAVVRRGAGRSDVVVGGRSLFSGPGRFGRVTWSPSGGRLLVPWPEADQWLFLAADGGRAAAVANIERQFARGPARHAFPDAVEWCCAR